MNTAWCPIGWPYLKLSFICCPPLAGAPGHSPNHRMHSSQTACIYIKPYIEAISSFQMWCTFIIMCGKPFYIQPLDKFRWTYQFLLVESWAACWALRGNDYSASSYPWLKDVRHFSVRSQRSLKGCHIFSYKPTITILSVLSSSLKTNYFPSSRLVANSYPVACYPHCTTATISYGGLK